MQTFMYLEMWRPFQHRRPGQIIVYNIFNTVERNIHRERKKYFDVLPRQSDA